MAVVNGNLYKGFTFGNINSKDYGVYVTGAGVFNSPEKDVEMIDVPGRNGAFVLDNGRWLNIEVAYPAGMFGEDPESFAEAISDLRNALASQKGYQILTDDYNPGEYREAIYRSGLEVTPAQLKAGEFNIIFDCKPQRWLTAGQDPITITSGGTITNPTAFDAAPLLMVDGYGTIKLGTAPVTITDVPIGSRRLADNIGGYFETSFTYDLDLSLLNTGDRFYISEYSNSVHINANKASDFEPDAGYVDPTSENTVQWIRGSAYTAPSVDIAFGQIDYVKGTAKTDKIAALWTTAQEGLECVWEITWTITYNGTDRLTVTFSSDPVEHYNLIDWSTVMFRVMQIVGISSKGSLGAPLYLDLDIGEAYKEEAGQIVSVNSAVAFGATLPTLPPGETEVTFPATVHSLKIVPRYWKL